MDYFKKFPIFFSIVILLILAFVGGVAYNVYVYSDVAKIQKKLKNARAEFDDALAEDPTQAAIDKARANIKNLEVHLAELEADLTRARGDIFSKAPVESYQLVEQLRGMVQKWRRTARQKGIAVDKAMDFGFKRYVEASAEPPEDAAVSPVWKQACVLNYINGKLFECKSAESPMAIVRIQRELLKEEGNKTVANKRMTARERRAAARRAATSESKSETFNIDPNITARKAGSLDTLAYRFTFAGHTDVLRRFLNQLKNFDAMLVVRSIDVKPADESVNSLLKRKDGGDEEEEAGLLDSLFGKKKEDKPAEKAEATEESEAASQAKTPVVTDNLSEFTVVIEYVEVVKDQPAVKKEKKQ